ncbi:hypothetical protein N2152v2_000132 [Parachlorella kessleri]
MPCQSVAQQRDSHTAKDTVNDWDWEAEPEYGPAFEATLRMLDWPGLTAQVAAFAQTKLGQQACLNMRPEREQPACQALLQETRAVNALEEEYAADIDFGGIQTAEVNASQALNRASRGGLLAGTSLLSVASLLVGAAKLQRTITVANREAERSGHSAVQSIAAAFKASDDLPLFGYWCAQAGATLGVATLPDLVAEIGAAFEESGQIRESASEDLKRTRAKVRTVEGRLRGVLKSLPGEVTQHAGRVCVACPANSDGPPKGILLGSGPGGMTWYVEPPAAVPLNNELAAARGEMYAAEEAVLWRLTSSVVEAVETIQETLGKVVWLDSVAARARYGRWVGGVLPEFLPFPKTGKARGGSRKTADKDSSSSSSSGSGSGEGKGSAAGSEGREEGAYLNLRRLRHPLLLGQHLLAKEQQAKEQKRKAAGSSLRRLPGWRSGSESGSDTEAGSEAEPDLPPLPIPIDVVVKSPTRAVIITGPNTGGKTATLKALGLAVLAAKSGLPIPASNPAKLPCFDVVLADIGDEQSLSASLSTFSGHLRRIEALRKESGSKSLVLLDEVGTGTDPGEGSALGIALLQTLVQGGLGGAGLTVSTTHMGALTSLKYEDARFENASVEFDEAKLAPTYRLLWGIPGRSNALNIAQRLGLEQAVIADARRRLGTAAAQVDSTIVQLEDIRRVTEVDEATAASAGQQAARAQATAGALR